MVDHARTTRAAHVGYGVVLAAVALALAGVVACTQEGTPCYPGDYIACACESAVRGYSQCSSDGAGYGACDCSGVVPGAPAATPAPAPTADGGVEASTAALPFLAPCERDDQCETKLCFPFNAKGPHCSHACTNASDCAPPSGGCSNQGICKVP